MAIIYQDGEPGKICTKCGEWRSVKRYLKRLLSRDGYDSICNECRNAASRDWRAKNKERVAELNREFYEANREQRLEYHRQYRQTHGEYFKEQIQKFRRENPDYNRAYMRRWARSNSDKIQAKDHARRAFKMGKHGSFTASEWKALKEQYNYTCLRCGRREPKIKLTADHIVPISKGGAGTIDNIQPLCKPCNSAKHDDLIDYRPTGCSTTCR
jgi:5-methylcytosine-specific restriction endonuclease McrA